MSPVKYKLCFYIPEDDILHSDRRENLTSYLCNSNIAHATQGEERRVLQFPALWP
jgi:hypothetical protein